MVLRYIRCLPRGQRGRQRIEVVDEAGLVHVISITGGQAAEIVDHLGKCIARKLKREQTARKRHGVESRT